MKDEIIEKIVNGDSKHLIYKYLTKNKGLNHEEATKVLKEAHSYLKKTADSLDLEDNLAKRIAQYEKLYQNFTEVEDFRGASDVLKQIVELEGLKNQDPNQNDEIFIVKL